MSMFSIECKKSEHLALSGTINVHNADLFCTQGLALLEKMTLESDCYLSLAKLKKGDSALLAALLAFARYIARRGIRLYCHEVPASVKRLISLYALESLFL